MARKTSKKSNGKKSTQKFNPEVVSKQIQEPKVYPKIKGFRTIGNCRYIENYLGIRLNGKDNIRENSEYYKIIMSDVLNCFNEPLSVAQVFYLPDRYSSEVIAIGNCRASKSQKALNVKLNDGSMFTISKKEIELCYTNIYYPGKVSEKIME